VPDVLGLKTCHITVAQWTLGQICKHLADGVNGSIDGLDLSRHRVKRFLMAKRMLKYTFRFGIPRNYRVDPNIEPLTDVDLDTAIEELTRAIQRFQGHRGPLQAHPLFGRMHHEVWDRLHRVHCAHHLSFAVPAAP
jgi:hypothetical protein